MSDQLKDWVMDASAKEIFLYVVVKQVAGVTMYLCSHDHIRFWGNGFDLAHLFHSEKEAKFQAEKNNADGFAFCGVIHPVKKVIVC